MPVRESASLYLDHARRQAGMAALGLATMQPRWRAQIARAQLVRGQTIQWDPSTGNYVTAEAPIAGGGSWYGGVYFPNDVIAAAQAGSTAATAAVISLSAAATANLAVNPAPPVTAVSTQATGPGGSVVPIAQVTDPNTVPPPSTTNPATAAGITIPPGTAAQTNVAPPGSTQPAASFPGQTPTGTVTTVTVSKAKTNHPTTATLGLDIITPTGPALGASVVLVYADGSPTTYAATAGSTPYPGAATIVGIKPGTYRAHVSLDTYVTAISDPMQLEADQDYNLAIELMPKFGRLLVTVMNGTARVDKATVKVTMGTETSSVPSIADGTARFPQLDPGTWKLDVEAAEGKASASVVVKAGYETQYTAHLGTNAVPAPAPSGGGNLTPLLIAGAAAAAFVFLGERDIEGPRERGVQAQRAERILPGTENMPRYTSGFWTQATPPNGIQHYGRQGGLYKIPAEAAERVAPLGYVTERRGSAYAYVRPPAGHARAHEHAGFHPEYEYELKVRGEDGKERVREWTGHDALDAAQRYADAHPGEAVIATRQKQGYVGPVDPRNIIGQVIDAGRVVKHGREWWLENAHGPYSGPYKSEREAEKAKTDLRHGRGQTTGALHRDWIEHAERMAALWKRGRPTGAEIGAILDEARPTYEALQAQGYDALALRKEWDDVLRRGASGARAMDLGGTFFDRDRWRRKVTEDDIIDNAYCEVCHERLKVGEDIFVYPIGGGVSYAHRRHAGEMRREMHEERRRTG